MSVKEKKYQISEIAGLIGVSKEMIRNYEKKNIITPERNEENNYRTYTSNDVFVLLEMVQNKELDISLKKIAEIKENEYVDSLVECYRDSYEDLSRQIMYLEKKKKRIEFIIKQIESCRMNEGNCWIEKNPSGYWFKMMEAEGDMVGPIMQYEKGERNVYAAENIVFMDCMYIRHENSSEWGMFLYEDYENVVKLDFKKAQHIKSEYCFCKIIDMGDFGAFNDEMVHRLIPEMNEKGYKKIGDIRGIILARGIENKVYRRYLKIMIPCERA